MSVLCGHSAVAVAEPIMSGDTFVLNSVRPAVGRNMRHAPGATDPAQTLLTLPEALVGRARGGLASTNVPGEALQQWRFLR